jgi:RNA polymerase sigma-70 factor (ECF subfamily)
VTGDIEDFYAAHVGELTLQLFCRALPRWDRITRYDNPAAWVRRVAWNLATSRWRRMRTAATFARSYRPEHVPGPDPDRVALVQALRRLPDTHRRAVVLHFMAGLTSDEIAAQEGVAASTVRVWLHRGRAALAVLLAEPTSDGRSNHV